MHSILQLRRKVCKKKVINEKDQVILLGERREINSTKRLNESPDVSESVLPLSFEILLRDDMTGEISMNILW